MPTRSQELSRIAEELKRERKERKLTFPQSALISAAINAIELAQQLMFNYECCDLTITEVYD